MTVRPPRAATTHLASAHVSNQVYPSGRRAHLLASSVLTGGTLRSLAVAAGMMTALGVSPAFAQCFSGGGSTLTTAASPCQATAATGTGSTAGRLNANANGQDA